MTAETGALALANNERLRFALSKLVNRLLPNIDVGRIKMVLPNGETLVRSGSQPGPEVLVEVKRWDALLRLASSGDIGLAKAYFEGAWSTPDLTTFFNLAMLNEQCLSTAMAGSWLANAVGRLQHLRRRNTRRGSRRNISEHYDLGNDFYAAWLDAGLNYSSALYSNDGMSLEEAQNAKLDRVLGLLDLRGGENVLEIGCGWGSLAERLVGTGCKVTGLTLSTEQLKIASERLPDPATADLRLQDYRDAEGTYDRLVSIEMLEAVGARYWPDYSTTLRNRMREGGVGVLQVITIAESRFGQYLDRPDFIQRYIFPGGMLPTRELVFAHAKQAGLTISCEQSFGESYARTLSEWRTRFRDAKASMARLGLDERFFRLWDYYLAYCEVGFRMGLTDVGLYRLHKR